jgi:membrane protein
MCHAPSLQRLVDLHELLSVPRKALQAAQSHGITRLAAAVAFYAVLSLAPMLILSLAVVQYLFGEAAARGELASAMNAFADQQTAGSLEFLITRAAESEAQASVTVFGIAAALFGASGVFYQLKVAMNLVWDVPPERKGRGWRRLLRLRIWGIGGAAGAILFIISTALATSALSWIVDLVPQMGFLDVAIWKVIGFAFTSFLYFVLFSLTFRFMPDIDLQWRHVWFGALLTAVTAALAQYLIGAYLARSVFASVYGAAGAIVIVLIWIYATSLILFAGAELTGAMVHDDADVVEERAQRQMEADSTSGES